MKKLNKIISKPWGKFYDLAERKKKWHLKLLLIKKGQRLSLQRHKKRSELWIVAEGRVQVGKSNKIYTLAPQKLIFINKNELHRIKALKDAIIVELSFGSHEEKDIMRLADDYGRIFD